MDIYEFDTNVLSHVRFKLFMNVQGAISWDYIKAISPDLERHEVPRTM